MLTFDAIPRSFGGFRLFVSNSTWGSFILFFQASPVYDIRMFIAIGSKIQPLTIALALALIGALVVSAFRISKMAPQYGRRRVVWFFISLFFTAIPATLVFWRDYTRSISARESLTSLGRRLKKTDSTGSDNPTDRCPHCGEFLSTKYETDIEKCPNCKMKLDRKYLA
jgi:hypothetical protein